MKIIIIAVGGLKNHALKDLNDEYLKRLMPLCEVQLIEVRPEPFFSEKDHARTKAKEAERLEVAISKSRAEKIYLLAEDGKELSSPAFAKLLDMNAGITALVIGGALGWDNNFKKQYPKISLSQMTFPHEIARVMLVEQIYRACMILRNRTYHY